MGIAVAHATTIIAPSFDELVAKTDYAVHAVVKSVSCEWRSSGANLHIVTKVELEIKEVILGKPPVPLVLEMLGGKIGDRQLVVDGAPDFKVGDEDILFVHGNGFQASPLVAFGHGRYPVARDKQNGRAYVTRSNGDLLYDTSEVARPMHSSSVARELKAGAQPLSPDSFVAKVRESRKLHPAAHEN
jgi:hypothetical protein